MAYTIREHTRQQAKQLGLEVRPSQKGAKKIDVLRDGSIVASVGHRDYLDYPSYKAQEASGKVPKGTAAKRRTAYHARHSGYPTMKDGEYTPGYLAAKLLW